MLSYPYLLLQPTFSPPSHPAHGYSTDQVSPGGAATEVVVGEVEGTAGKAATAAGGKGRRRMVK